APASWDLFRGKPEFSRVIKGWGFFGTVSVGDDFEVEVVCRPIAPEASPLALRTLLETTRWAAVRLLQSLESPKSGPSLQRRLLEKAELSRRGRDVVIHSRVGRTKDN